MVPCLACFGISYVPYLVNELLPDSSLLLGARGVPGIPVLVVDVILLELYNAFRELRSVAVCEVTICWPCNAFS